ncbi:MAG: ABC transporter ATP-binding protein [Kineosporiaceae bacterium]|nr:ABC transporter ATP-binding protein [Aeromicrobium sp.]
MTLEVTNLSCGYDGQMIIHDVSLSVPDGGFATILGSNNAGKSTLINCISGIVPASGGSIVFDGVDITHMAPHRRVGLGVVQVPEGRQLFAGMTVMDNILMGAVGVQRAKAQSSEADIDRVLEIFPRLRDRRQQVAGSLSGGEQQMLAMARGLMSRPRLLMLDEPSLGLAPLIVESIFQTMSVLNDEGVSILLVEQNLTLSLQYAATGFVLDRGEVAVEGSSEALQASDETRRAYLGI